MKKTSLNFLLHPNVGSIFLIWALYNSFLHIPAVISMFILLLVLVNAIPLYIDLFLHFFLNSVKFKKFFVIVSEFISYVAMLYFYGDLFDRSFWLFFVLIGIGIITAFVVEIVGGSKETFFIAYSVSFLYLLYKFYFFDVSVYIVLILLLATFYMYLNKDLHIKIGNFVRNVVSGFFSCWLFFGIFYSIMI